MLSFGFPMHITILVLSNWNVLSTCFIYYEWHVTIVYCTIQDVKIGKEYQAEVSDTVSAIISGMTHSVV